jgi:hypothetical protein
MAMTGSRLFYLLFVLILTISCEDHIDKPLATEDTNLLIVEGILTNENINHLVRLSHPYATQNGNSLPISSATVKILEGNNIYPLVESPAGSGLFYTSQLQAVTGKIYKLVIQYNGKEFFAQDSAVPVEGLAALDYHEVNDKFALTLSPSGRDPNFIEHTVSWETTSSCTSATSCKGDIVYYDLKTIDVNEIFKPEKKDFAFPLNTVVIRKKFSVSSAYREFLRGLLSETQWRGGVFDVQRANVSTNLSDGAVGFFAVSTIVADTTLIIEKP